MKLFLILIAVTMNVAVASDESIQLEGNSYFKATKVGDGKEAFELKSTHFLPIRSNHPIVYKIERNKLFDTFTDGSSSTTDITAYKVNSKKAEVLWSLKKIQGSDFRQVNAELFSVTQDQCCTSNQMRTLIGKFNGKVISARVASIEARLWVPFFAARYLTTHYLSHNPAYGEWAPVRYQDKEYTGSIGYFSASGEIEFVHVYSDSNFNMDRVNFEVTAPSRFKRSEDGYIQKDLFIGKKANEAYTDINLTGKTRVENEDKTFSIAIRNDQIDLSESKHSSKVVFLKD
jgi:hypothetical protein